MMEYTRTPMFGRYLIDNDGDVWSNSEVPGGEPKMLKPNTRGERVVVKLPTNYKVKTYRVANLVLTYFVGEQPDGQKAIHLDGDLSNCVLENLKWGTRQDRPKRGLIDPEMQIDLDWLGPEGIHKTLMLYWVHGIDKISIGDDREIEYRTVQYIIDHYPRVYGDVIYHF